MAKSKNLLPPEALKLLNKLLADTAETGDMCRRCANCGLDVDKEERKNREQAEIARKLKAEFFPNEV